MLLSTTFADRVFKDLTCNLGAVAWENIGVSLSLFIVRNKEATMHAVRATALLLLLLSSATQAVEVPTTAAAPSTETGEKSPAADSGTGAPSTDNAGTGSTSSTASPS